MSVAKPWMLGSPAPFTSHSLAGLPGSRFSATIRFCATVRFRARVLLSAPAPTATDTPAGSAPLTIVQLYGGVPPLAVSVALYALPMAPGGSVAVVTV